MPAATWPHLIAECKSQAAHVVRAERDARWGGGWERTATEGDPGPPGSPPYILGHGQFC